VAQQDGLDQLLTQKFMRIRWTLSKKLTILILAFIGIGAIIYNYIMQFKDMQFNEFYDDEEDTDLFDHN
jgi:plastocyanin domain-containing protein